MGKIKSRALYTHTVYRTKVKLLLHDCTESLLRVCLEMQTTDNTKSTQHFAKCTRVEGTNIPTENFCTHVQNDLHPFTTKLHRLHKRFFV